MGPLKAIPEGFTSWDKIEVRGPATLQQIFDQIKQSHNVNASMVTLGKVLIYNNYDPNKEKQKARLEKDPLTLLREIGKTEVEHPPGRNWVPLDFSCETVDGDDAV